MTCSRSFLRAGAGHASATRCRCGHAGIRRAAGLKIGASGAICGKTTCAAGFRGAFLNYSKRSRNLALPEVATRAEAPIEFSYAGGKTYTDATPPADAGTRLVSAITNRSALLLVRAETRSAEPWLTPERVEDAIARVLMGPTDVETWRAAPGVVAAALRFPAGSSGPMRSLEVHTVSRRIGSLLAQDYVSEVGEGTPCSVTPVMPLSYLDNLQENIGELNCLLEILVNGQLSPQFQPIISLADGRVMGYESLIRGPKGAIVRRPGQMFRVADKGRIVAWFDLACLDACLKMAAEQQIRHLLFINMDAEGLSAMAMQDRPIALRARERGLAPGDIVIEVTERQTVGDFPGLIDDIAHLREQGFRIAIDDAGAGYNSLRAIAEVRPEFVKIDRDLVKNLDVAGERRALLKSLAQYARSTGAFVVAEGAETMEEVTALIDLGIPYCQGFALGKPSDAFRGTPKPVREMIERRVAIRERRQAGADITAAMLARPGLIMDSATLVSEAVRRFVKAPGLTSIAISEGGKLRGLLPRRRLDHILLLARAAQAAEMMPAEAVSRWMRPDAPRVSLDSSARDIMAQIMAHPDIGLDTDLLVVTLAGDYAGVVSVRDVIEASAAQPARRALYSDPLTGLAGCVILERELAARIEVRAPLAIVRVDIRELAAVNSAAGLERGDDLIRALSRIVAAASAVHSTGSGLAAHLGGDDFVVLTSPEATTPLCRAICAGFAEIAPRPEPIPTQARSGRAGPRIAPCGLTVAAVTTAARKLQTVDQAIRALQDAMRAARSQPAGKIWIDSVSQC